MRSKGTRIFKTALGWSAAVASAQGITRIVLPKKSRKTVERELNRSKREVRSSEKKKDSERTTERLLNRAVVLLLDYFSGRRISFDVNPDVRYYTAFQRAVWKAAAEIPSGETRSYAWIANRIKKPLAARAVGRAMGANPIPILVP